MRNSTKMGGAIKKKYQVGGKVNNGRKGLDPKMSIDTFKKGTGTGKDMRMSPSKIQVGTTKPMTPAEKAKRMEDFMKLSPKKKMGGAKKYQKGGAIIASPISGPRRKVAGSNMAKGGSLKMVNPSANPGLAKLPTPVRNKMGYMKKGGAKYQAGGKVTDSRTKKGLADGKMSKGILDYSAREIAEGIYNTEKANAKGAYNTVKGAAEGFYNKAKTNAGKEYDDLKKVGNGIYNEAKRKAGQASDAFDAGYNFLFKQKGGAVKNPGFKAVQSKIAAKSGVSKKAAGAILASSTRKASAKAKAANPRLKRVKG